MTTRTRTLPYTHRLVYQQEDKFNLFELKILRGRLNPPVYLFTRPNIKNLGLPNFKKQQIIPFVKPKLVAHFNDHKILDHIYKHYQEEITLPKDKPWRGFTKERKWKLLYELHLCRLIYSPIFYKFLKPEEPEVELDLESVEEL